MHATIELNRSDSKKPAQWESRRLLTIVEWALATILTLTAVCLYVLHFHCAGALWRDEVGALNVARLPWHDLVSYFPHEAFPLLFPIIVRGYTGVAGTSEVSLRLFGLGVAILWLAVIWFNARLLRRGIPLIGIAFVGMSSLFFVWGATIRGYGLGVALIMLTFGLFSYSVVKPRPIVFFAAGLFAMLSVQCLLANVVVLFALCVSAAITQLYQKRVNYALITVGIGAIAAASMLPYIGPYSTGRDWDVVLRIPVQLGSLVSGFIDAIGRPTKVVLRVWAVAFIASGFSAVWLLQDETKEAIDKAATMFAVLVCLVAPLFYVMYLQILSYQTADWYFFALIAIFIVAMDSIIGMAAKRFIWMRITQILVAAFMMALSILPDLAVAQTRMTNLDLIAADLKRNAAPKDLILVLPWFFGISFQRYYEAATPWETMPRLEDLRMHRYDLIKERMTLANPLSEVLKDVTDTLVSGHRLWIVAGEDFAPIHQTPPHPGPAPYDSIKWDESAYRAAWIEEFGFFIQKHALHSTTKWEETSQTNEFEYAGVTLVDGWKD